MPETNELCRINNQQTATNLRISFLPLFFLVLPLLEIAGFVIVGQEIGALATIGLVILSSVAGVALLRHQGTGTVNRVRATIEAGEDPSRQMASSAMSVIAAILLILPGFITSTIGLLILLPPVRALFWKQLGHHVIVTSPFGASGPRHGKDSHTIDLDSEDFSRNTPPGGQPDKNSPWRHISDD